MEQFQIFICLVSCSCVTTGHCDPLRSYSWQSSTYICTAASFLLPFSSHQLLRMSETTSCTNTLATEYIFSSQRKNFTVQLFHGIHYIIQERFCPPHLIFGCRFLNLSLNMCILLSVAMHGPFASTSSVF